MTYTTQQLIQILDQELRANWKGERIVLSSESRIDYPVVAKALDPKKLSKVFAYQDFRHQIHEYQREHQVSGIIWRICTFNGNKLRFPELHNQLIPVDGDKATLIAAKESVLEFWSQVTQQMKFWLASDRTRQITPEYIEKLAQQAEWAEIDAARTEVYLGLCWGNPQEYQYQWALPTSGCHRIIAAVTEPSSIKV
ncbi:MAG: hypothetical protein F6K10_31035 [Moorea sp. SIO2B7]|nr:hypothetical protein [Moorena sp. SIO2B7]